MLVFIITILIICIIKNKENGIRKDNPIMYNKNEKLITVIIGDLVGSRDIEDRIGFSHKMNLAIKRLDDNFVQELRAPMKLTRGIDEFAAILKEVIHSFEICQALNEELFPIKSRFIIAQGPVDIGLDSHNVNKMDGPIFHKASMLMNWAKRERKIYGFFLWKAPAFVNILLTGLSNMIATLMSDRSNHQNEIIKLYRKYGIQKRVADKLHITQQAVSHALKASKWDEIAYAEKIINGFLSRYDSEGISHLLNEEEWYNEFWSK